MKIFPPKPGHYLLIDQLQPFVREEVYVLLQPLHAVSDRAGHFRIEGVPAGQMSVAAELSAVGGRAVAQVDVHPKVVENVELTLTYTPKAAAPVGSVQPVMP